MAYVWLLSMECGSRVSHGIHTYDGFDSSDLKMGDGRIVTFHHNLAIREDSWWCDVIPKVDGEYLNGHGGPASLAEAVDLCHVGLELYKRLQGPIPFRFAMIGTEAGSSGHSYEDLVDIAKSGDLKNWHGTVVNQDVANQAGSPSWLVPFSPGKFWVPWQGEKFEESITTSSGPIQSE